MSGIATASAKPTQLHEIESKSAANYETAKNLAQRLHEITERLLGPQEIDCAPIADPAKLGRLDEIEGYLRATSGTFDEMRDTIAQLENAL